MKYMCQTCDNYLRTTYFISFHCFIPNQYQVWSWNGCLYQKKVGTLGQNFEDDHHFFCNKNKPMQTGTIHIFIIHAKNSCFHLLPPFLPWIKKTSSFLAPFMPWLLPTLDLPTGESRRWISGLSYQWSFKQHGYHWVSYTGHETSPTETSCTFV